MKKIQLLSIIFVLAAITTEGQETSHYFFRNSDILKPFLSEIRSSTIKGELAWLNKLDENYYLSDYSQRPFIEVHLGTEIPLFCLVNNQKGFKLSTKGYVGNILLIDMFEKRTAPIINTDYFFGIRTAAVKYVNSGWIKNLGIKIDPLFHESTHIGDEFSLHGFNTLPEFRRINISFEAWELAFVINDPDTITTDLFSVKAGFHGLWNNRKGYFTSDSLETKGLLVSPSQKNYEYYLQVNLQRTKGFLCSDKWVSVISAEAANRLRLSYDPLIPEKRKWNFNLYVGWKYRAGNSDRNIGFFFRYYAGIIPNGQFRNTDGFRYAAISLTYD